MTAFELLSQEAARLLQDGKTPSLALLRSRLGRKVQPAELLPAFQQWKQLPEAAKQAAIATTAPVPEATAQATTEPATATERLAELEARVLQLEQRLARLETTGTPDVAG